MRAVAHSAVFALIFAISACASGPAQADVDSLPADPALLHACVASAGTDRAALEHCVGAVAQPCIAAQGGVGDSHVLCWDAEANVWDEIRKRAATQLIERQSYRSAERLASANEKWEAWREAECSFWSWEEGGGSGEQVDRVHCAANFTAARAITLLIGERP